MMSCDHGATMRARTYWTLLPSRFVWMIERGWYGLRLSWYTTNKARWVALLAIASMITRSWLLLQTVFEHRADRRDLTCLARNVYFESRGEPLAGQYAVAEVTMNRTVSGRYPATVCGVVYQKNWDRLRGRHVGAFSW